MILGQKLKSFIDRFNSQSRKKSVNELLLEDIRKYIAVEKGKIDAVKKKEVLKKAQEKPKKMKDIRPEKDEYQRHKIVVGSTVKLIATKQNGTVEEISGDHITVTFGFLRMKVEREKLIWVK